MRRLVLSSLIFVFFISLNSGAWAGRWGKNRLWKDGRAEVAVYESERVVYGKTRKFREQLITVREDLRTDTLVKADNPKKQDTIGVFKLNNVQKFDTENYPYSYMASVFVAAANPSQLVKVTVGSQEWCGNTFKIFKDGQLEWHSYFDGEADGKEDLLLQDGDLFRDQLPLTLRDFPFKEGTSQKVRLWDNLTTNHGGLPQVQEATITVDGEELVRCRAGSLPSWKVVVKGSTGTDTYWFQKEYPHILTKMITHDGQKRLLYGRARWSYWDKRIPQPNILK